MRFFWIIDRVKQGQFKIYWRPGKLNLADYFTKHHLTSHHRKMRPVYLTENGKNKNILWRGCVSRTHDSPDDVERLTHCEPLQALIAHMCCNDHIRSGCNDPSSKVMTNYPVTSDITAIASRLQSLTDSHRLHYSRRLD